MTASLAKRVSPASASPRGPFPGGAAAIADNRPIDLVHLARQTFGEKRLETELLRMFMRQARQILASLAPGANGAAATTRLPAADLLHTLVGSARVVGAFGVAACAEALEQQLRGAGGPAASGLDESGRTELGLSVEAACGFITALLGPA